MLKHKLKRIYTCIIIIQYYPNTGNYFTVFDLNVQRFVCKAHYFKCILNELGIKSTFGNRT